MTSLHTTAARTDDPCHSEQGCENSNVVSLHFSHYRRGSLQGNPPFLAQRRTASTSRPIWAISFSTDENRSSPRKRR